MNAVLAGHPTLKRRAIGDVLDAANWVTTRVDEPVGLDARVRFASPTIVLLSDPWPDLRAWLDAASRLPVPTVVVGADRSHDGEIHVAGVRGLLGWPMPSARLDTALRAVDAGFEVRETRTPDAATQDMRRPRLSPRERQILAGVAVGASNKQIAARCDVSPNTVKFHLARLFQKLGVTTRAEAVATAIALGELAV
jgi:DNA-binding NarL/FixJ family response regulator